MRNLTIDAAGVEAGLVTVVFGHAILTQSVIGVFLLLIASVTVIPSLYAREASD